MTPVEREDSIKLLQDYIDESRRIVFFGGAGVSTESGIPDFRSVDGLYSQKYDDPPETILSHEYLEEKPEKFFRFYREKLLYPDARPNPAHKKLALLEQAGKVISVVTQNIDGLHQMAGSRKVCELHGSVLRNYCIRCGRRYALSEVPEYTDFPHCACGGMIRPDVVLYGEPLDDDVVESAVNDIYSADMLVVAGTSLRVYPAAGLIRYFHGARLVIINKTETEVDRRCSLVIRDAVGEVFNKISVSV